MMILRQTFQWVVRAVDWLFGFVRYVYSVFDVDIVYLISAGIFIVMGAWAIGITIPNIFKFRGD